MGNLVSSPGNIMSTQSPPVLRNSPHIHKTSDMHSPRIQKPGLSRAVTTGDTSEGRYRNSKSYPRCEAGLPSVPRQSPFKSSNVAACTGTVSIQKSQQESATTLSHDKSLSIGKSILHTPVNIPNSCGHQSQT